MTPIADEHVAARIRNCPAVTRLSEPTPIISTTPHRPSAAPNHLPPPNFSCGDQIQPMRHTNSGAVEFRIAAKELSTDCCPSAINVYGIKQAKPPCTNSCGMKCQLFGFWPPTSHTTIQIETAASNTRAATMVIGGIVVRAIFVSA